MKNRKSLSSKLIGSYFLLILVITICLSILASQLLGDHFFKAKQNELISNGLKISDYLSTAWKVSGSREYEYVLQTLAQSLGAGIMVIDRDGRVVIGTFGQRGMRGLMGRFAEQLELIEKTMNGEVVSFRGQRPYLDQSMLIVGIPVFETDKKVQGAVFLYAPIAEFRPLVGEMQKLIFYSAVIVGLLALLLGYFLSHTITRPLRQVTKAAREVGAGNLEVRVDARSNDEVGELGATFNRMTDTLRRMIQALSYEKDRMQQMLTDMAEGVLAVDHTKRVLLVNEKLKDMFGLRQRDVLGRFITDVDELDDVSEVIDMSFAEQTTCSIQSHIVPGDRTVIVHASPLGVQSEVNRGAIVVVQDITDLEKVDRLRKQVVANVSHELRTPLTVIKAYAEALEDGMFESPDEQHSYLVAIREEADRLNRLVTELLDLSKIQSGQMKLQFCDLSLKATVNAAVSRLNADPGKKGPDVINRVSDDLPLVRADADRLLQVVTNLLGNAIRYTPSRGKVEVTAVNQGTHVQVLVSDTGIGIPEDHLPLIWERFHKVDESRTRNDSGTGLGLSIVKSIVEAHGGEVWAESKVGEGSTFVFTLPVSQAG